MPTLLLHLREMMIHNLEATGAIIAVLSLAIYVQFASHAFRVRRHNR